RRYGAHGTSHRYVAGEMAKLLKKPVEETCIVTCHIGNGSSISAVKGGKCIDTSMGVTPLAGVLMGTRCGDIDPAIVPYIMNKKGYTADEMADYMNKQCGLLGISGVGSDCRDVEAAINAGNERAKLSFDILAYQIKKYIGSYTAAMNGLDCIVFTAGVGENDARLRALALENMDYYGIKIDPEKNNTRGCMDITAADSKVKVLVIPTNEELVIASDTMQIVSEAK
ncbi:MAG: acetate/propionate family kinase, partial [Clostridia bacterium]|nr:acetate/propionate family kinase [Clostridia bacterium]